MSIVVTGFYKFVAIEDGAALRAALLALGREIGLKGTIIIAPEGINATISGTETAMARATAWLTADRRFSDLRFKRSMAKAHPFQRFKVKMKREIVSFGVPQADPARRVGTYVPADKWNALILEPDVLVLDTRNSYEVSVGTFDGAREPGTRSFRQFADFVKAHLDPKRHGKIAMFCTGGIRCEKASSYLLAAGFPEVYHLEGGILNYLDTVPIAQSLWRGECFVFDERIALEHGGAAGSTALCAACGQPIVPSDGRPAVPVQGGACPVCGPGEPSRRTTA